MLSLFFSFLLIGGTFSSLNLATRLQQMTLPVKQNQSASVNLSAGLLPALYVKTVSKIKIIKELKMYVEVYFR